MKKSILFTFFALTLSTFASGIDWKLNTLSTANYMVGADGNKLTGTAYLMLTDDVTSTTFTSEQDIINLALGGSEGSIAIVNGVNTNLKTTTDNRLVAPTEYSFTVLIFDSGSGSYYTTASKTYAAYNPGADADHYGGQVQMTMTAGDLYATAAKRGTQDWVSVPEPSTAALALAGLALLLKRRRA